MNKLITILLLGFFMISFVSASSLDVKSYWLDMGLSDSEAEDISLGSADKELIDKAKLLQEIEEELETQDNESIRILEEAEDEQKNLQGVFLMSILGVMVLASFGTLMYLFFFGGSI